MSNTFLDSSSNALTVTRNGNVAQGSFSPYNQNTVADSGWSAYFDGNGDFLNISASSSLALGSGDFTIECWFYAGKTGDHYLFDMRTASGIYVYLDNTSLNYIAAQVGSTGQINAGTYASNTWNHFAVVRSGSGSNNVSFYLNGVRTTQATDTTNYSTNTPIFIGRRHTDFSGAFGFMNGYISNFRVIKGTALYIANFNPSTTPLTAVANTALLACHTTTLVDGSSNTFTITKSGDTKVSSMSPFDVDAGKWSTYFDGNGDQLTLANNAAFEIGSGNFSYECFVYAERQTNTYAQGLISYGVAGSTGSSVCDFQITNTGYLGVAYATGAAMTLTDTTLFPINQWVHAVVCRTGTTLSIFVNGRRVATTTTSATVGSGGTMTIGGEWYENATTRQLKGFLSNVRVLKGASAYDATQTTLTVPTSPLTAVANTVLLTCQDAIFDDVSTNNFAITRNGDARTSTFSPYSPYTSGYWSGYFDGTGDYLTTTASTELVFGTGNFTIESWVMLNKAPTLGVGMCQIAASALPSTTAGPGFGCIYTGAAGNGAWGIYYGTGSFAYSSASDAVPSQNVWYHVAFVRSSGVSKLYVNGVEKVSVTDTTNYANSVLTIGGWYSSAYMFQGYMSNFRIVKGTALYTSAFTPSTTPLTAVSGTTLLTLNDNRFRDNSLYQRAITRNGDVRVSASVPFLTPNSYSKTLNGGSAYFDGTGDYLTTADNATYDFGTNNFTIEAWIYPTTAGTVRVICSHFSGSDGFSFELDSSNRLKMFIEGAYVLTATTGVTANAWNHVAVTRSSGTLRLFLNGILDGSVANSTAISGASSVFAVPATPSGTFLFTGYMSDLNVVNGQALYTANFVPPKSRIADAGASLLLNFANTSVTDFAAKSNVEMVGNVALNTTTKKFGTSSIYFPGSSYLLVKSNPSEFAFGTGDFTIEAWIYRAASGVQHDLIAFNPTSTNGAYPALYISSSNTLNYYTQSADRITGGTINTNTWYHIALCRSGTSTRLFIDGVQSGSTYTDTNSYLCGDNRPVIGSAGFSLTGSFNGYIDDLRVTKGVARYTGGFTVPTSALTSDANTSLLVGQNSSFKDNSSANRAITVNGNTRADYRHPFTTASGYWSNYFDGTGDFLTVADNTAFDLGNGAFTIECSVYFNARASSYDFLIGQWNNASDSWLLMTLGNTLQFWGNGASVKSESVTISLGQWYHFACTRDSSNNIRLFVNGVMLGSTTPYSTTLINSTANVTIGSRGDGLAASQVNGYMSNVRVVKGTALYTSTFTPSTTPLTAVAGTSLLTCQDSTLKDNSSNAFTITKNGDVASNQLSPYMRDAGFWSAAFDGNGDTLTIPQNSAFNLGTGAFTVEAWVYYNGFGTNTGIINLGQGASSSAFCGWTLLTNNSGGFRFYRYDGSVETNFSVNYTFTTGVWYHICVVRNASSNFSMYVNGSRVYNQTVTTSFNNINSDPVYIGAFRSGSGGGAWAYHNGYISNVRVVNGTAVYDPTQTSINVPTSSLTAVAGTSLLTCRDILLGDASTNTFTVTKNGDVKSHWQSPFFLDGKWSNYFDGTSSGSLRTTGITITEPFTYEAWVYPTSANVVGLFDGSPGTTGGVRNYTANKIAKVQQEGTGATFTLTQNAWQHFAATFNSGVIRVFVNGNLVGTGTYTGGISGGSPFDIGTINGGADGRFAGYLSNVRVTSGLTRYSGGFTPPTETFPTKGVNV